MTVNQTLATPACAAPTRTSLLFSFAEKYTLLLMGMGASMWIARLLTPAEIGQYAVGAVLVGLAQTVRDFGVGAYLIQEEELTMDKMRAALTVSVLVAWLLALVVALSSWPAAIFYRQPVLQSVLLVLALNFLLLPFSAITLPCLRRQLRFSAIYLINVTHGAINLIVSVSLALWGFGAMSLAWAALAATLAALLLSLRLRPPGMPWRPGIKGLREIVTFGLFSTGGGLVDEAGVAAPDLIIGKIIGVDGVALFGKATGMLNLFNQAITSAVSPVIFPLFSAQARNGGNAAAAYLSTIAYMTALSWPFFTFLGLMASPLLDLLYGPQWGAAAPLIRLMCFSSALYSMFSMARYLLVAMGQVRAQARLDATAVAMRIAVVLLAAPSGLPWVAWAVMASLVFRSCLAYRSLHLLTGLRGGAMLFAARKSLGLSAFTAIAPLLVLWHASPLGLEAGVGAGQGQGQGNLALPALSLAAFGALLGWTAGIFLLQHEIAAELNAWRQKRLGPSVGDIH